jgi:STE24 endopeptidase
MLSALFLLSMGAVRRAADAANVFIVDAAIGLGRPGTLRFLSDTLMRLIVTSIVNLPLLIAAALLMESRSPMWWLAAWAIWLMLVMLDLALRPLVQTRLLYTATRLHNESLAAQIAHLLMRCGLRLASVQVLDASSRTRRANASVHGLGRQKHIYLHDTLLERLRPNEILAVVAHEAGHARHRHVLQHLAVLAMLGFAAAAGASVLLERLGATTAEQLAMIVLLTPSLGFLARPIMFKLSRRFEYEADAFSAAHVGAPAMAHALERLYVANAGVPESDPLYAAFHASHPGPRERLGRLDDRGGGR